MDPRLCLATSKRIHVVLFIVLVGIVFTNLREVFKKCMDSFKNCTECEKNNSRSGSVITTAQCGTCSANQTRLCYDKWIGRCNSTTHRATKVIRLDTTHARYLLENHKRLKLIQLFRDPRAVISSRNVSGWYYRTRSKVPGYITNDVKVLCRRMENDLASALELKVLFPDRVKIIQYEDFYDPIRTAKIFYNFLNMKMTDYIKNSKPVSQKIDKNLYNRKTKRFYPDSYRDRLDASVILDTNKYCENVYVNLGLRIFKSKVEVKNKSLSVVMGKIPYPLD